MSGANVHTLSDYSSRRSPGLPGSLGKDEMAQRKAERDERTARRAAFEAAFEAKVGRQFAAVTTGMKKIGAVVDDQGKELVIQAVKIGALEARLASVEQVATEAKTTAVTAGAGGGAALDAFEALNKTVEALQAQVDAQAQALVCNRPIPAPRIKRSSAQTQQREEQQAQQQQLQQQQFQQHQLEFEQQREEEQLELQQLRAQQLELQLREQEQQQQQQLRVAAAAAQPLMSAEEQVRYEIADAACGEGDLELMFQMGYTFDHGIMVPQKPQQERASCSNTSMFGLV